MSSHHIVREKQEPALLVLGLDDFPDEMLGQLLEWSPTVITTPQTAEKLVSFGIKIDWVISDGQDDELQPDVKLMSPGNGNLTDAALSYLADNEYPSVNVVTDDLDLDDYRHFTDRINLVIFNNHQKIYPVVSGFSKWKAGGETVTLLGTAPGITVNGLNRIESHQYKTIADGFFSLYFDFPFLFIAEDI